MTRAARKYQLPEKTIADDGLAELRKHHWPGNVRELSHAIERAVLLSDDEVLGAGDFQFARRDDTAPEASLNLQANERRLVELALEQSSGNVSHAAAALGITRAALYRRIEKFGL